MKSKYFLAVIVLVIPALMVGCGPTANNEPLFGMRIGPAEILVILIIILVVALLIRFVIRSFSTNRNVNKYVVPTSQKHDIEVTKEAATARNSPKTEVSSSESPLVLLKLRLAKGEITKAEYDDIKKVLEE